MSKHKLMAGLAAATSAIAIAVPTASASAQPFPLPAPIVFTPPHVLCVTLVSQIQFALATGHPVLANLLSQTFIYSGCGGAAI